MMRQALVALGPKSVMTGVLVGGAALALGALFLPQAAATPGMCRLVLHAPIEPGAFYLSAWSDGDVIAPRSNESVITYQRRGDEHDGCTWLGNERLTRLGPRLYAYEYSETIVSCRPDARPFRKTPRAGIVTVEEADEPAVATPRVAVLPPDSLAYDDDDFAFGFDDEHCVDSDDTADVEDTADDVGQSADDDADDDAEVAQQLADARQQLADAQREIADAVREANDAVKAALDGDHQ